MKTRPIGVFDSGVGGLSVLKELHALLPGENYVFLADQKHVPYGEKTPAQLQDLSVRIGRFLLKHKVKLIVVACNTATCYAIDTLRKAFTVPIVGTVPAVKPAAAVSRTRTVAVLSTPATSRSDALKELISRHAQGVAVLTIGCLGLENAVETGSLSSPRTRKLLKKYVAPLTRLDVDQVVLGCTHYPFLAKDIRRLVGPRVGVTDSGQAIARRVRQLLKDAGALNPGRATGARLYFTTGNPQKFSQVASKLLQQMVSSKKVLI